MSLFMFYIYNGYLIDILAGRDNLIWVIIPIFWNFVFSYMCNYKWHEKAYSDLLKIMEYNTRILVSLFV